MNFITPVLPSSYTDEEHRLAEENIDAVDHFMRNQDLRTSFTIALTQVEIDGDIFDNYEARIVSRFYKNGDVILGTADGFFLNGSDMVACIKALL